MKKVVIVLMVLLLISGTYAEGKQLTLVTSSVEDGATEVSVDSVFELEFSNNVINMKVKEKNMTLIKLINRSGDEIPVEIIMADDQVSPELKRIVKVEPVSLLENGESYKLVVMPGFSSKNGSEIQEDVVISFDTEGGSTFTFSNILIIASVALIVVVAATMKKKNAKA